MNDYRRIRRRQTGRHHNLRPDDTCAMFRQTRAAIMTTMALPFDGPTVVVTHHAPSPQSLDDPHMDLRWCYASDLSDLMDQPSGPDLWIHGHLHSHCDYHVGRTRVVANPRGHVEEVARAAFVPDMVVDL